MPIHASEQLSDGPGLAQALFHESADALFLIDPDTDRLLDVNAVAMHLCGFERGSLLRLPASYLLRFPGQGGKERLRTASQKTAIFHSREGYLLRTSRDGVWVPVNLSVSRLHVKPKTLALFTARDIREQRETFQRLKRLEAELREQQVILHNIIAHTPCAVFWKDRKSAYLGCNEHSARDIGLDSPKDIVGKTDYDMPFSRAEADFYRKCDREVMESGQPLLNIEETQRRPDGSEATLLTSKVPLRNSAGAVVGVLGVYTDITDRKKTEEALRASEARFRTLFESTAVGIVVKDRERRILDCNPAFARFLGHDRAALIGLHIEDVTHPEDAARSIALLQELALGQRRHFELEKRYVRKDGRVVWGHVSVSVQQREDGVLATALVQDISERKRLEDQFRQAQKMEAVGRLAGGVAHDFNNLLCVINGYADVLLAGLPARGPDREMIVEIKRAGERAAGLTRRLLAFSRQEVVSPRLLDLNSTVHEADRLLRRLIGEDIQLITRMAPGRCVVKADPSQLEQVLLNLAVNARDAMPKGGTLTIETHLEKDEGGRMKDEKENAEGSDSSFILHPSSFVVLSVSDTGHGMDEATRARIFEPFFTTKGRRGTGLGLATVYSIVAQSGGHIEVDSAPGQGTTFRVYLPCAEETHHGPALELPAGPDGRPGGPLGTETVLLAEDEEGVRALTRLVLRSCGYEVLEAGNGVEALSVAAAHPGRIDLLVTDVVMPQLSGREAAERLQALFPQLGVLFLSGYPDDDVVRHGILEDQVAFLQKPFTPAALALKVRQVLDARSQDHPPCAPSPLDSHPSLV
ncbi:MAG: PAS domain S-box protein [Planctomycetes bacterium]|nr:PAS domain S-box protein [Planctomycetota bacterium]